MNSEHYNNCVCAIDGSGGNHNRRININTQQKIRKRALEKLGFKQLTFHFKPKTSSEELKYKARSIEI